MSLFGDGELQSETLARSSSGRFVFASLALLLAFSACVYPATEALVTIDTDVPLSESMTITVRVFRGRDGGRTIMAYRWSRIGPDAGRIDGGAVLPATFAIIPGDYQTDGVVRLEVEGEVGRARLRRTSVFTLIPRTTARIPIFLNARCAAPAVGCGVSPCVVQQLCEERGQTCGNNGQCVSIETRLNLDGGITGDIVGAPACGAYAQTCCNIGTPCPGGLSCVSGTCRRCTDPMEVCCNRDALLPNGTECAMTSDPCRLAGVCTDGVCAAVTNAPDGTQCAAASGPCTMPSVCMTGTCTPQLVMNGTDCGANADVCRPRRACQGGACTGFINAMTGTTCGSANPATCRAAPNCAGGVCQPAGPIANGTVCRAPRDRCELNATCSGGTCDANPSRGNNTAVDGTTICCGGNEVSRGDPNNCNICGLRCGSGNCVREAIDGGQYYCTCSGTAQCSPRICRVGQSSFNNRCACENNAECPTGNCVNVSFAPNYCAP